MARAKNDGKGRMGGRGKGTPNKVTTDMKEWVSMVVEGNRERFERCLQELEPQEYVRVFTTLLNYVLPKQAPTNPDSAIEKERAMLYDLVLTLPDEMVERVSERLHELNGLDKGKQTTNTK